MIKAKKGLLITLFAAMMVFAFGATSAFAAETTWADDYSTVTVDGYTYNTVRTFNTSDGSITAIVDPATDVDWTLPSDTVTYYDLSNAAFADNSGATIKGEYKNGAYTKGSATQLLFSAPSYVTNKTATAKAVPLTTLNAATWQGKVVGDEDYDSTLKTEQTFTLSLEISYVTSSATPLNFCGVVPEKAVKVQAGAATASDIKFYKDEVPADGSGSVAAGTVTFNYDAAAHKLVNTNVDGYTVSYAVFNKTTGKYDAASECPTVTNVADTATVKATISDGYATTDTRHVADIEKVFTLKVAKATAPKYYFDKDGNAGEYAYSVAGTEFDAYSYIVAQYSGTESDANLAAVAANQEELLAFFKDYYEITATNTKAAPDVYTLTIEAKKLTADEVKALETTYATLMENFGVASGSKFQVTGNPSAKTATMTTNDTTLVKVIEFTDTPTVVKYKAKKLKKKAASFTVTAVCNTGEAVTYKLTNAPEKIKIDPATGTITLAKKLKKGVYKIGVTAYLADQYSPDGSLISETQNIKIKVKK